jgi:hypothetical protein
MPPRPDAAPITDVRQSIPTELSHAVRRIVLVVPYLAKIPLERMRERTGFPGTRQIPAAQTMRALLAMKLFGSARHSHVLSSVFDQGLALFAGLNGPRSACRQTGVVLCRCGRARGEAER